MNKLRYTKGRHNQPLHPIAARWAAPGELFVIHELEKTIMKWILTYILMAVIFFPCGAVAQNCNSASDCNSKGTKLYAQSKFVQAIKYFEKQADLATGKEDKINLRTALNNLAIANLKIGNVLLANAWIQEAKDLYADDKATSFNYELIEKELKKTNIPSSITGTFSRYAGYGRWSTLEIVELKKGKLRIELYLQRFGLVESAEWSGPAAYWELSADVFLAENNLTIKYQGSDEKECAIRMKRENEIKIVAPWQDLTERCETGGYNTYVHGTYWRTSTKKPLIQKK
jgi:tetratricopeptide (TPR) repeat protein